jgi:hypothetical protein
MQSRLLVAGMALGLGACGGAGLEVEGLGTRASEGVHGSSLPVASRPASVATPVRYVSRPRAQSSGSGDTPRGDAMTRRFNETSDRIVRSALITHGYTPGSFFTGAGQ